MYRLVARIFSRKVAADARRADGGREQPVNIMRVTRVLLGAPGAGPSSEGASKALSHLEARTSAAEMERMESHVPAIRANRPMQSTNSSVWSAGQLRL
jgi:hypothetical protein